MKTFSSFVDKHFPKGWRWLGIVAGIALLATAIGYAGALLTWPFSQPVASVFFATAEMMQSLVILLVVMSIAVIAFARGERTFGFLSIATLFTLLLGDYVMYVR